MTKRTNFSDLIGRLEPEGEQELPKKIQVSRPSKSLDKILKAYHITYKALERQNVTAFADQSEYLDISDFYNLVEFILPKKIKSSDIDGFFYFFCKATREGKKPGLDDIAGVFLSVLMNRSETKEFYFNTGDFNYLENIGVKNNGKRIVIGGIGGNNLGAYMDEGSIHVKGDAGVNLGYRMKGGLIEVDGDADELLAADMKGGKIIVKGKARVEGVADLMKGGELIIGGDVLHACSGMENGTVTINGYVNRIGRIKGGTIYLNGAYDEIETYDESDSGGGEIYHKDKLIVKDGKFV